MLGPMENFTQLAPSGFLGLTLFRWEADSRKTVNFTIAYFINEYTMYLYIVQHYIIQLVYALK